MKLTFTRYVFVVIMAFFTVVTPCLANNQIDSKSDTVMHIEKSFDFAKQFIEEARLKGYSDEQVVAHLLDRIAVMKEEDKKASWQDVAKTGLWLVAGVSMVSVFIAAFLYTAELGIQADRDFVRMNMYDRWARLASDRISDLSEAPALREQLQLFLRENVRLRASLHEYQQGAQINGTNRA